MQDHSPSETKLVIILTLAFALGLVLGLWLSRNSQPDTDPRDPKPPAGKYYDPTAGTAPDKVLLMETDAEAKAG